ncbi:FtsW/RodA/SpoVE family cell cycle protein, partial [Paenibacillus larvae]
MLHKLKRIDGIIVTLLLLLMTLSIFIVYSATIDDSFINVSVWKSVTFCLIGIAAFLVVSLIDYRWLLKWIWYPYGVATVLLVLVMKFASKINGATGWFSLPGGLQFQPAELMKLVLILALAHWLGRRQGEPLGLARDLFPAGIITFLPFVIVLMHPDL